MLSREELEALPESIRRTVTNLEHWIVEAICDQFGELASLTPDELEAAISIVLEEAEMMRAIDAEIQRTFDSLEESIHELMEETARDSYVQRQYQFNLIGRDLPKFEENYELQALIAEIASKTYTDIRNLSGSMGFVNTKGDWVPIANFYRREIDQAAALVRSGETDIQSAMRSVVRTMADRGLTFVAWESGTIRRMDTTVRMNMLGAMQELQTRHMDILAEQIGADGFEVVWHPFHRPSHDFGGQQFSMDEFYPAIDDMMHEPNCKHDKFPVLIGISVPTHTAAELARLEAGEQAVSYYEGVGYTPYEATQKQRRIETSIRQQHDRINAFDAATDEEEAKRAEAKLQRLQVEYKTFSNATGVPLYWNRTY